MPIDVSMTDDGGLFIEAYGVITDEDLRVGNEALYNDVELTKSLSYQLMDVCKVERIDISSKQLAAAAEADRKAIEINPKMRIAILVRKDIEYGLARIWEAYASKSPDLHDNFRIFKSRKELDAWIKPSPVAPG